MFLEPKSSSRVLDHLQSPYASKPICGGSRLTLAYYPCVHASLAEVLAAAGPVVRSGSVGSRWAMGVAPSSVRTRSQNSSEMGRGDETPLPARAYHALGALHTSLHPRMLLHAKGEYNRGEGNATTTPWTSTIYYADVSSGPRPKAHWYMLTHQCCSDTAPYWTPHRAAQSSGPTTTPLQCLSTSYHQV